MVKILISVLAILLTFIGGVLVCIPIFFSNIPKRVKNLEDAVNKIAMGKPQNTGINAINSYDQANNEWKNSTQIAWIGLVLITISFILQLLVFLF